VQEARRAIGLDFVEWRLNIDDSAGQRFAAFDIDGFGDDANFEAFEICRVGLAEPGSHIGIRRHLRARQEPAGFPAEIARSCSVS